MLLKIDDEAVSYTILPESRIGTLNNDVRGILKVNLNLGTGGYFSLQANSFKGQFIETKENNKDPFPL